MNFVVDLKHRDTQAQTQNSDDDLDGLKCRKEKGPFRTCARSDVRSTQSRATKKKGEKKIYIN